MMALTETPVGVEKKLAEVLARIWDNHEFILGTRLFLQTDEERQSLIDAVVAEKLRIPATFFYLPTISIKKEKPLIREWLFRCLFLVGAFSNLTNLTKMH